MKVARKGVGDKTTIWEDGPGGRSLLVELPGLPYGIPSMNQTVRVANFGEAVCWGTSAGAGATEVKLVLKRGAT